jgi:hypothetical protein
VAGGGGVDGGGQGIVVRWQVVVCGFIFGGERYA